jgi:hypothetical protein
MSESKIPPQMWPDREEIQKKGEFEAFKRKLEPEREKTLHQLWHEAEESVKKLWERGRNEEESFWKYALVHKSVPISYPRDPSEREKLIKKLQDKGQFHPRIGRRRESSSILQLEVETIHRELQLEHIELRLQNNRGGLSEKKAQKLKEINLPSLNSKTVKQWQPLIMSRFLAKYDNNPGLNPDLQDMVKEEANRDSALSKDDYPMFSVGDIKNLKDFVLKINQPTDAFSSYLKGKLTKNVGKQLSNMGASLKGSKDEIAPLTKFLNSVIKGPSIYETRRFKDVVLRKDNKRMLKKKVEGKTLALHNRRLLEDVYPFELLRDPTIKQLNKKIRERFAKAIQSYANSQPIPPLAKPKT